MSIFFKMAGAPVDAWRKVCPRQVDTGRVRTKVSTSVGAMLKVWSDVACRGRVGVLETRGDGRSIENHFSRAKRVYFASREGWVERFLENLGLRKSAN